MAQEKRRRTPSKPLSPLAVNLMVPSNEFAYLANKAVGYEYLAAGKRVRLFRHGGLPGIFPFPCACFLQFVPLRKRRKSGRYYDELHKFKNDKQLAAFVKENFLPPLEQTGALVIGLGSESQHNRLVLGEEHCLLKWEELEPIDPARQAELKGKKYVHDTPTRRRTKLISVQKTADKCWEDPKQRERALQLTEGYRGQEVVLYDDSIGAGISHAIAACMLNKYRGIPFEKMHPFAAVSEYLPNNKRRKK